jgi:hypothetical protein
VGEVVGVRAWHGWHRAVGWWRAGLTPRGRPRPSDGPANHPTDARHATPVASAARQLARAQPAVRAGRAPGKGGTGHRPGAGLGSAGLRSRLEPDYDGRAAPAAVADLRWAGGGWRLSATGLVAEPRVWTRAPARVFTVSVTVVVPPVARPGRAHATTSTLATLQARETSRENWHAMTSALRGISTRSPVSLSGRVSSRPRTTTVQNRQIGDEHASGLCRKNGETGLRVSQGQEVCRSMSDSAPAAGLPRKASSLQIWRSNLLTSPAPATCHLRMHTRLA